MKINIKKTKAMVVRNKPNSPKINIAMDNILNTSHHIQCMYLGSLRTEHGRSGKGDQEKNNDGQYGTDHIQQHENTIVSRHRA